MLHFLYLLGFSLFIGTIFGLFTSGSRKEKLLAGIKSFGQFVLISLALAWVIYFIPW